MNEAGCRTFAVIPARQGSVRLPGKNVKLVGGVPLVVRAVKHALTAGALPLVTTDDPEVERLCGDEARLIPRPPELATATASTADAVLHALEVTRAKNEDVTMVLQPTSPFRSRETLRKVLATLNRAPESLVLTVGRAAKKTDWVRLMYEDGRLARLAADGVFVFPTGSVYACKVGVLRATGGFQGMPQVGVFTSPEHSVDIDFQYDLEIARAIVRLGAGDDVIDIMTSAEKGIA